MSSNEIASLTEEELRRFLLSMGLPPVLSTEDPKAFEELFLDTAQSLMNPDRLSLYLIWEITVDTWNNARYARHETITVNRWWSKAHESQLAAAKTMKATYEESLRRKAAGHSTYPADVAQAAELQETIDDTAKEIDAIIDRVPMEADFNNALRANAGVLHDFDQLRNGANRRRFGNCVLLDRRSAHLERTATEADGVVDGEYKEVQALSEDPPIAETQGPPLANTPSPSIVPTTEHENSNDIGPQNRSESAQ